MQMLNVEKERDQYVSHIKDLKRTLEIKEMEQIEAVSNLESVIANLQIQLVETENSSQIDTRTIKKLKDKLAAVETQFNKAKASDKKRAQIINELESKLTETDYALSEKEQLVYTQNILIQDLEEVVKKTQIELQNAKKSKAIESERVKELEVELYELSTKYEENNLDDNLSKIKDELEKVRSSESKQAELVKTLESQLKEAEINRDQEMFKLQEAIAEIKVLKVQYNQLKGQINDANEDSPTQIYMDMMDNSTVEDLVKQLDESRTESKSYRDRVEELEILTKQLESDKTDQMTTNANLLQQVEQLQKELETLAEEFTDPTSKHEDSEMPLNKIKMNSSIKNKDNDSSNLAFAKLTEVNNSLRKTNEDLTSKILQAKNRMNALSQKIKHLESELMSIRLLESNVSNNDESVRDLQEKIRELEAEKEGLKQDNSSVSEERNKLDQKIKSLLLQLESLGRGGNETALQLSELNNKILELENEISGLKDTSKLEKEMEKLSEINEKLGKEIEKNEIKTGSVPSQESNSPTVKVQTKLESTIVEQENLIKTLKEKIFELETRVEDESIYEVSEASGMLDLDAVGGSRISAKSSSSNLSEIAKMKNKKSNISAIANYPITPPPTPPPSHSLSSILMANSPTNSESRTSTRGYGALSPPPRNVNSSPTPAFDFANAQPEELRMEIQKLQKRITKMEGEKSIENNGNLENSLKESETNLRVAKQQLQILQREKTEFLDQIKKLRSQLDEANLLFESTKSSVQEEKKVIETVLEEERRAKENAEKARRQLENRMEELMAKRSKFMCF
jgi:chromosome segregation ATPase